MKKSLSVILAIVLVASLFTGCDKDKKPTPESKIELTSEYDKSSELVGDSTATGELKIAVSLYTADSLSFKQAVKMFRQLYPKVILTIDTTSYDAQNFWTDLNNGKGPDLFFTQNNENTTKAIKASALADMGEYFERDTTFPFDEYNQAVIQGSNPQGKQYLIPLNYSIPLFITTKSMVKQSGLNLNACIDTYNTANEFSRVIQQYKDNSSLEKPMYTSEFPLFFPMNTGLEFIDYENRKVKIDSPEVKKYADTVRTSFDNIGSDDKELNYLKNKKTILYEIDGRLTNILYAKEALDKEDEAIIFPLRNVRGNIQAEPFQHVAVSNTSLNKQNAYYFIKVLLSGKIQFFAFNEPNSMRFLPVSNYALKLGLEQQVFSEDIDMTAKDKDRATQFINEFINFTHEVDSVEDDSKIHIFFVESMLSYYDGTKSYEECIADAEKKIQAYVFG